MYTAIVISPADREALLDHIDQRFGGWETLVHHVTVNMGSHAKGPMADVALGTEIEINVTHIGSLPGQVCAVKCEGLFSSKNSTPHITVAVNRDAGAKPMMSNNIEHWHKMESIAVVGTLQEC